jgi:hypothetical protein
MAFAGSVAKDREDLNVCVLGVVLTVIRDVEEDEVLDPARGG